MSFQTIIIAGHLGRDPEMRYTPAGQAVTNFNLATNRQYTDSSGHEVCVWHYRGGISALLTTDGPEKNTIQ